MIITISPIPELWGPPDVQAKDFLEQRKQYLARKSLVERKREQAAREAAEGARRLAEFPFKRERSGVTACASTLALTTSHVSMTTAKPYDRMFLIASDLEDSVEVQLKGDFDRAPITLLQPCPGGVISYCTGLARTFTTNLNKLNAGRVTTVRSELSDRTIDAWLDPTVNVGVTQ